MVKLTSSKMEKWAVAAGCIGILCFFLPFYRLEDVSLPGFLFLGELIPGFEDVSAEEKVFAYWLVGAVVAGIAGAVSTRVINGDLFSALADVAGAVCLYLSRKSFLDLYDDGAVKIGWTLMLIAYVLASVLVLTAYLLTLKEAEEQRRRREAPYTPAVPAPPDGEPKQSGADGNVKQ